MGRVASKLGRRVDTRFNAANRAQKFIDDAKTAPNAPSKYESSVELLKHFEKEYPDLKEIQSRKDASLNERLKQVRIESFGLPSEVRKVQKLPQDRSSVAYPQYGHIEPYAIARGNISIRRFLDGLEKGMIAPKAYTHVEFADEYKLEVERAGRIFHYFKPYTLYTDMDQALKDQYWQLSEEDKREVLENRQALSPGKKED